MTQNQTPVFVVLFSAIVFSVGLLYMLLSNYSDDRVQYVCGDVLLNDESIRHLNVNVPNVESSESIYSFYRIVIDREYNSKQNETLSLERYKSLFKLIKGQPKKIVLDNKNFNEDASDKISLKVCINKPRGIKQNEITYQMLTFYPSQSVFRVSKNRLNVEMLIDKQWVYFDFEDELKMDVMRIIS